MELTKQELTEITGGGISLGLVAAIGAAVTLIVGIVDGFLRPLKCNK